MTSRISYFLCLIILAWATWFYPRWEKQGGESTLGWDVSGYYWYLPSQFIYHDLKEQKFKDSILSKYRFTSGEYQQGMQVENGNYVMKYSSGMAVMYAPFFFIAHAVTPFTHYPANGFSKPYMVAVSFGSLLIAFIGLWYMRKLLLRYYHDNVVAIVLLLLVIGSNYLNYAAIDGALSHNWLFTVYVFLLLATDNFYKTYKTKYAVWISLLCGLAVLARPTEIISLLIPLLWKMEGISAKTIKGKWIFIRKHFQKLIIAAGCFILIASLQLIYWKYVSGHWLVYSYGDQGFSWKHPHFFDYTFSYRSGWITYTPLAIFFLTGILPFIKYGSNKIAILSFFFINYYIVCAWDIWWYAGTGGRAMIQSYPVLLFPLASFIQYLLQQKWRLALAAPFLLTAAYVNIWFTIQAHGGQGLYDSESMNKKYYWRVVGRFNVPEETQKYKDTEELLDDWEPTVQQIFYTDTTQECLDAAKQESEKHTISFTDKTKRWLRTEADFSIPIKEWSLWKMTQFKIALKNKDVVIRENMIRIQRMLVDGETQTISIDLKIPDADFDSISVWAWNAGSEKAICIRQWKIYALP